MIEKIERVESAPVASNGAPAGGAPVGGAVGGSLDQPGNPVGRRLAHNRKIIMRAISDEQLTALVHKLYAMAEEGHVGAAKLLLQYYAGKPVPVVNPDRVNHEEWEMRKEMPTAAELEDQQANRMPHRMALTMAKAFDEVKRIQSLQHLARIQTRYEANERRKEKRRAAKRRRQAGRRRT